jgi:hypothetical protein
MRFWRKRVVVGFVVPISQEVVVGCGSKGIMIMTVVKGRSLAVSVFEALFATAAIPM